MAGEEPSGEIEVGASEASGDLRYWRAKEAVRQGEARLTAQAAIRTAMEARATLGTELEALESIAGGISPGIQANNRRLDGMGRLLRWAGWLLIAAPLAGAATYLLLREIT